MENAAGCIMGNVGWIRIKVRISQLILHEFLIYYQVIKTLYVGHMIITKSLM